MLNDAFKLTVDKICMPSIRDPAGPTEQQYRVKGYPDNVNMWQPLCSLGRKAGQQSQPVHGLGGSLRNPRGQGLNESGIASPNLVQPGMNGHPSLQTVPSATSMSAHKPEGRSKIGGNPRDEVGSVNPQSTSTGSQVMRGFTQDTAMAVLLVNQYEMRIFNNPAHLQKEGRKEYVGY